MQDMQYAKTSREQLTSEFVSALYENNDILAAINFGSIARQTDNYLSDIDLALWVKEGVSLEDLAEVIKSVIDFEASGILVVPRKQSIVIYTAQLVKIDCLVIRQLENIDKVYKGSNIPKGQVTKSILFDKTREVAQHLMKIGVTIQYEDADLSALVECFVFNFENCSRAHAKSDAYRFYFNYNIALHTLMQIKSITRGVNEYLYAPKNVNTAIWDNEQLQDLYDLHGVLFLPKANEKKRHLLNVFYELLNAHFPDKLIELKPLCERFYSRDYFWNLRDFSIHTHQLKANHLYRSSSFSLYNNEEAITKLGELGIKTIIDLRAPREVEAIPYKTELLENRTYVNAPFDPWNQPDWFQKDYNFGSNRDIAYRYFLIGCQTIFKQTIEAILSSDGNVLIHCHAGKDRTGLLIAAIQLLLGVDQKNVLKDYLASNMDTTEDAFNLLLEQILDKGSISSFFDYQGVNSTMQEALKHQLTL